MKTDEAHTYMNRLKTLNLMIDNKRAEINQWRDAAVCITSNMDGEKVQSSGNPKKMEDAIIKYIDLEREAESLINDYVREKAEIISVIEQLPSDEYDVLHKIYIQCMPSKTVADMRDKSYAWVRYTRRCAFEHLQKILDQRGGQNT